ncbi:AraC family transcriptional regulator [Rhodocytophaga rosea]|uniref:AraC family transcriptional regulator n=1 Tax=Rhodocytophaga rosea TaxID=2704465 RepID=A0A6C0GS57_9BACT|nr:helix-turn-helix domain-containing protein [Rhodocytophaga rosea]QHT70935.1 AraC family transcriptional regulator [Rhodocytophaga rosea]
MKTVSYSPAAPLSHFIDIIWCSQAVSFDYCNLTLPMLHQELIINFSDQFLVSRADQVGFEKQPDRHIPVLKMQKDQAVLVNNEHGWISGLQTRPIYTSTAGNHFTIGVLFKPWGLQALTGINAFELQDSSVSMEAVFGKQATELIDKIYEAKTPAAIFVLFEKFLWSKLGDRHIPGILLNSLSRMKQARLVEGIVGRIADEYKISSKTFIQSFKKYIGITPGKFHHLLLLNQTLQHLIQHPSQPLTESTYDLDFYDQAHFIHFFKRYTGFTPATYIRQFRAGRVLPASPHIIEIKITE